MSRETSACRILSQETHVNPAPTVAHTDSQLIATLDGHATAIGNAAELTDGPVPGNRSSCYAGVQVCTPDPLC